MVCAPFCLEEKPGKAKCFHVWLAYLFLQVHFSGNLKIITDFTLDSNFMPYDLESLKHCLILWNHLKFEYCQHQVNMLTIQCFIA